MFSGLSPWDGGRSSMVEHQIVVLAVAGSSPVGHPIPFPSNSMIFALLGFFVPVLCAERHEC